MSKALISVGATVFAAIPAASVMIREAADGQFELLLESSLNGPVWTLAQPGTYGGSTQKRFIQPQFRTPIVRTNAP